MTTPPRCPPFTSRNTRNKPRHHWGFRDLATRNISLDVPDRRFPQTPVVIELFRMFRVRGRSLGTLHARLDAATGLPLTHLPRTSEAEEELSNYEIRVVESVNDRYGAFRVGTHDDLVTALGLAVQADYPVLTVNISGRRRRRGR